MKSNKKAVYVCSIVIIVLGILLCFTEHTPEVLNGIFLGVFTGFVVSLVLSLINYFNEKEKLIEITKICLSEIYISIGVTKEITGSILVQLPNCVHLEKLNFKLLSSLAASSVDISQKSEVSLFNCFWSKSEISHVFYQISEFYDNVNNLRHILSELEIQSLLHDNNLLKNNIDQTNNQPITPEVINHHNVLRRSIDIRVAKVHEYQASLLLQMDKLLQAFYRCSKGKKAITWEQKKTSLINSIDNIVQSHTNRC